MIHPAGVAKVGGLFLDCYGQRLNWQEISLRAGPLAEFDFFWRANF